MQPFHDLLHRLDRWVTRHNMEVNDKGSQHGLSTALTTANPNSRFRSIL